MDEKRFAAHISERLAYYKDCLTLRPGSSLIFIGVDAGGCLSAMDAGVAPSAAREIAAHLILLADEVDAEIAADALEETDG